MFKPYDIIVDATNPFKNDYLFREKSIKSLTNVLKKVEEPFVLCINGSWGTGKSKFIEMWKQYLNNENINSIYFNAWKHDYSDDPVIALLGEISLFIDELDSEKFKEEAKSFKEMGAKVAKVSLPLLSGAIVNRILGQGFDEKFAEAISSVTTEIAKSQISAYEDKKKSIETLQNKLEKIVRLISANGDNGQPLFFFIDELDRCNPQYAIKLLEKAKHIFNVRGIIFVLALDKTELSKSIENLYGKNFDTKNYLMRFIDLEFELKNTEISNGFYENNANSSGLKSLQNNRRLGIEELDNCTETLYELSIILNLSLRQQQRLLSQISLLSHSINEPNHLWAIPLTTIYVLQMLFPDLYNKFVNGNIDAWSILNILSNNNIERLNPKIISYILWLENEQKQTIILEIIKKKESFSKGSDEFFLYEEVTSMVENLHNSSSKKKNILQKIKNRIELFEPLS